MAKTPGPPTSRELAGLGLLLLLLALSGERESELRARLETERAYAEAIAFESADWIARTAETRTQENFE